MITMRGKGLIIPVEWDERGNVLRIAISTQGEGEYHIDPDEKGEALKAMIRKEVDLTGEVRMIGRKKVVKVKTFHLVKDWDVHCKNNHLDIGGIKTE
ncbi:hypothetical protein TRIP_B50146 [uncultured Desulfatiglans sp.]|nr:hypothetical protein TRIP_B50146 [uncultured Desulfatiglans sp.]